EAKTAVIDGLVNNGNALGLGERNNQWLLPVGHKARVHIGFQDQRVQGVSPTPKSNTGVLDIEVTTDFAVNIQKRGQIALGSAFNKNIPVGYQRGTGPRG